MSEHVFLEALSGQVDREHHIIRGVSLIKTGDAKGHDMTVDETTLSQIMALFPKPGLKGKINHKDAKGVLSINGKHVNPRITKEADGHHIRADWQLNPGMETTPTILSLAEHQPEHAGISLSLGTFKQPGADKKNRMRVTWLKSADLVDDPACNDSLLEAVDNDEMSMADLTDLNSKLDGIATTLKAHGERLGKIETFHTELANALKDPEDGAQSELSAKDKEKLTALETENADLKKKSGEMATQLAAVQETLKTIKQAPAAGSGTDGQPNTATKTPEDTALEAKLKDAATQLEAAKGIDRTVLASKFVREYGANWKTKLTELSAKK